jgi:small subunit ribosomal protein S13
MAEKEAEKEENKEEEQAKGKKPKKGKDQKGKDQKPAPKKTEKKEAIMRLAETNLDGNRQVGVAIRRVRGVGTMLSNAIVEASGFRGRKLGELTDQELKSLEDIIASPGKHGIPSWMFNRRKDPKTAEDKHMSVSALEFQRKLDINELKKIKCYKGMRHGLGLTVRGQRTRGAFRKSGKTIGVSKKKAAPGGKK